MCDDLVVAFHAGSLMRLQKKSEVSRIVVSGVGFVQKKFRNALIF